MGVGGGVGDWEGVGDGGGGLNLKFLITTRLFSIFCKKRPLTCW